MTTAKHHGNEERNPRGILAGFCIYGGATRVERPGSAAAPGLGCKFILERIGSELLMPSDCPGFRGGVVVETVGVTSSGPACGTPFCTLAARDEDAGTLAGVLGAKGRLSGGIAALNHRLPAEKPPASSNRRRPQSRIETPEYPEWVGMATSQGAGNKRVMCVINANCRVGLVKRSAGRVTQGIVVGVRVLRCRAKAVELIAFLNTRVHAVFRLSVGGTSALTPALSRSGEGEFSTASARCDSLGLSCGGHGERGLSGAAARNLEDNGDVRGRVKWGASQSRGTRRWRGRGFVRRVSSSASGCRGAGRGTWCQVQVLTAVEIPGSAAAPGSGCEFVMEDVGGEWIRGRECPECGGARLRLSGKVRHDDDFAGSASDGADDKTPDSGVSAKRIGLCHPFRVVISLLGYQGWLHATPGYSNGILSGCARRETPEYLEWVGMAMAQDAGGKWVMRLICPDYQWGKAKVPNDEDFAGTASGRADGRVSNLGVAAKRIGLCHPFRLGVGGTSALTPALSRSGEGEFSTASARCGSLGLSCGGHGEPGLGGIAARNLEDHGDVRGRVKWGASQSRGTRRWRGRGFVRRVSSSASGCRGAGRGTWCQVQVLTAVEIPGSAAAPGSGCEFVMEDVGGEWIRGRECPECRGARLRLSGKVRHDDDFAGSASDGADGRVPNLGVAAKRIGLCHPL